MAKQIVVPSEPTRTYWAVTEDGAVVHTPARDKEIAIHADQTLVGLTDESRRIIEQYELNDERERSIRILEKEIKDIGSKLYENTSNPVSVFTRGLYQVGNLNRNAKKLGFGTEVLLRRMAFSNIISILETFLSDHIIDRVKNDDEVLSNLGKKYRDFKDSSYKLSELIDRNMSPRDIAIEKLQNTVFHNLSKINIMYESAFGITFPRFGTLITAIEVRHDIVHRNGYQLGQPGNQPHDIRFYQVRNLIFDVQLFVKEILLELVRVKNKSNRQ